MQFSLTTHWHLDAPIERVWEALSSPEQWPRWWRYVLAVVDLEKGDADGVGALRRYTWSSRLPYRLSFNMRTNAIERPLCMQGTASGDLDGTGMWRLEALGNTTRVRYDWTVMVGKPWMRLFAPLLAPVFAWNHDQVMREGGAGLARHLGVALLGYEGASATRSGRRER
jgi:carbon monoxide dehydrogenase subunit G